MSQHSSSGRSWSALRQKVLERDGYICTYGCGREATQVDHVVPKANGGTDDMDNLVAACQPCNNKKSDKQLRRINYFNPKYLTSL